MKRESWQVELNAAQYYNKTFIYDKDYPQLKGAQWNMQHVTLNVWISRSYFSEVFVKEKHFYR